MQQVELCTNHGGRGALTMTTKVLIIISPEVFLVLVVLLDPSPYPFAPQSPCSPRFHQLDLLLLFSPNLSMDRSRFAVLSFSCLRLQSLLVFSPPTKNKQLDLLRAID